IDTQTNTVRQTFDVNPLSQQPIGSAPNALAMLDDSHLAVSLGRDNAVAVYTFHKASLPVRFEGLVPVGWYPVGVRVVAAINRIVVTKDKGIGSLGPKQTIVQGPQTRNAKGHNVYSDVGTMSVINMPTTNRLVQYTGDVYANNNWYGVTQNNQ